MNFWDIIKKFLKGYDQEKDKMMIMEYCSEEDEIMGVFCILKNNKQIPMFCYFNQEQWEMILDTSLLASLELEEVVRNIVSDLETIAFLNPDDF